LRERLGIDYIISVLQRNRLQWFGHMLQKADNNWVKKCVEYEVEGSSPRSRLMSSWREVVQKHYQVGELNREDAMYRSRWRKLIMDG